MRPSAWLKSPSIIVVTLVRGRSWMLFAKGSTRSSPICSTARYTALYLPGQGETAKVRSCLDFLARHLRQEGLPVQG